MKFGLKFLFAFFLSVTVVVAWLVLEGQRERTGLAEIDSREPDGWYVLAELLRQEGYAVETQRIAPAAEEDLLVVAFPKDLPRLRAFEDHPFRVIVMNEGLEFKREVVRGSSDTRSYGYNYRITSELALDRSVEHPEWEPGQFTITKWVNPWAYEDWFAPRFSTSQGFDAFTSDSEVIVTPAYSQFIYFTYVVDSTFIQNRHIGELENAAFILTIFRSNLEPGGRIVFLDAPDRTVFSELGNWSRATIVLIALLAAVFFVGSRRFGRAYPSEPRVRSTRDLIVALAQMLKSANHPGFALQRVVDYDIAEIRRQLRLPTHVPEDQVAKYLTPELQSQLKVVRHEASTRNARRVMGVLRDWRKLLSQFQTGVRLS